MLIQARYVFLVLIVLIDHIIFKYFRSPHTIMMEEVFILLKKQNHREESTELYVNIT